MTEPSSPAEELRKAADRVMQPPFGLAIGRTLRWPLHDLFEFAAEMYSGWKGPYVSVELSHFLALARAINGTKED
ncbi:hypothetical protein [Streptomyces sp. MP131-18]|uniref:hypothetical protein n=1 Tax=Streptomyces sp. MP131-18 TaxID=1857892 RepID=UPI00097C6958|nr:hypothetical protein [Streptomyces sp. MP131-18]ONK10357.1 hypothetical protein STBA_10790 [Streptomyces sp. MP131-18]